MFGELLQPPSYVFLSSTAAASVQRANHNNQVVGQVTSGRWTRPCLGAATYATKSSLARRSCFLFSPWQVTHKADALSPIIDVVIWAGYGAQINMLPL